MLTLDDLDRAQPQLWQQAGDDAATTATHCENVASVARDEVAHTLASAWASPTGVTARTRFAQHADSYQAAALTMRALAGTYDRLATAVADAQRTLCSALDFAASHQLKVNQDGSCYIDPAAAAATATATTDQAGTAGQEDQIRQAQSLITGALRDATAADTAAAEELRTLAQLAAVTSPQTVQSVLVNNGNNALAVAMRLQSDPTSVHPVNVPPELIAAADKASAETGISKDLLLAIMWQEQQWYQNQDPGLDGPLTAAGRLSDWTAEESLKPDKSLGITHMKLATARTVIYNNPDAFPGLAGASDAQLAKFIEENPDQDVRLSAYYLQRLKQNPQGATTDKQLFLLYAADTPQVRNSNAEYGDDGSHRGGAIKHRSDNWDNLQQSLEDADAWNNFSEDERRQALAQLAAQTPSDRTVNLNPVYASPGVSTSVPGTAPLPPNQPRPPVLPPPGTPAPPRPGPPAPSPGPSPTPPAG
ncbi:hypothetical protein OG455_08995 [Kitasatospora sp. NBC_01287]|uniref:hypothetical protein n=1 Tax=Kitasatospora sp. NBC_01287 TaxID=2903573 RepID=UPI00224DD378|nr:hypothetical protein [Kitasatospora sp. NBC_01287]MCX4745656.1 hypothetical protein [Kitasatospora sp. NBC_01287]